MGSELCIRDRCEKAALVIVRSLQFLSETSSECLEELIYMAALGKCFVTQASFDKAGGELCKIKLEDVLVMEAACNAEPPKLTCTGNCKESDLRCTRL